LREPRRAQRLEGALFRPNEGKGGYALNLRRWDPALSSQNFGVKEGGKKKPRRDREFFRGEQTALITIGAGTIGARHLDRGKTTREKGTGRNVVSTS